MMTWLLQWFREILFFLSELTPTQLLIIPILPMLTLCKKIEGPFELRRVKKPPTRPFFAEEQANSFFQR